MAITDNQDDADARQQRLAATLAMMTGVPGNQAWGKELISGQDSALQGGLDALKTQISQNLDNQKLAEDINWHKMINDRDLEIAKEKANAQKARYEISPKEDQQINTSVAMVGNGALSYQEATSRLPSSVRMEFTSRLGDQFPDFNSPDFKVKQAALHDFATGPQGQQLIKMQNASKHLDLLGQMGNALSNGDVQAFNKIANLFGVQSGSTPQAAYNAVAPIVANEVMNASVKGGGGEQERQQTLATLSSSLSGPQRSAAIAGIRGILGAQADNLRNQYQQATGRDDFDKKYPGFVGGAGATPGTGSGPPGSALPGGSVGSTGGGLGAPQGGNGIRTYDPLTGTFH
jgi:hypothetical protein